MKVSICFFADDGLEIKEGQYVHAECRRLYCHPNQERQQEVVEDTSRHQTRKSSDTSFDLKTCCLFCGKPAKVDRHKRGRDVYFVRTLEFQNTVRDVCKARNDYWGNTVLYRLEFANDLPAADAIYHQTCSTNFRSHCNIPQQYQDDVTVPKRGRPASSDDAFLQVMQYLEQNMSEQLTVSDLVDKMISICDNRAYSLPYMKTKIMTHFGPEIVISSVNGKHNVVTFRRTADAILHYAQSNDDVNSSEILIKAVAKLIVEEIKSLDLKKNVYPTADDIMNTDSNKAFVPQSLLMLLPQIVSGKGSDTRCVSIGQCIVQACTPRAGIAPLQIGLGVQLHHHFGSKFLIDTLNSLGFCTS